MCMRIVAILSSELFYHAWLCAVSHVRPADGCVPPPCAQGFRAKSGSHACRVRHVLSVCLLHAVCYTNNWATNKCLFLEQGWRACSRFWMAPKIERVQQPVFAPHAKDMRFRWLLPNCASHNKKQPPQPYTYIYIHVHVAKHEAADGLTSLSRRSLSRSSLAIVSFCSSFCASNL